MSKQTSTSNEYAFMYRWSNNGGVPTQQPYQYNQYQVGNNKKHLGPHVFDKILCKKDVRRC